MLNERAVIKSKMGSFDTMAEQLRIRKAELNSRLLRARSDEAERDAEIKTLQEEFEEINQQIIQVNQHLDEMTEHNKTFRERLSRKDDEIRDLQGAYQSCRTKLDTISNLTERYEGYGNSIRRVMEAKNRVKGIHGVVADIITTQRNTRQPLRQLLEEVSRIL